MGERKGVNKYYPPDWDPSKGSINQYVGQHPLRDRARKLSQGILIIRFEMPYNIWCGGCNSHIGMGVRYNAEKTKTGMYYSTPIYKFRMKCHLCDNHFEIQTDPKNHDYVILEGARRKEQRWDPKENEQIETEDKAVQKKMATDAMFKLEHGSDDIQKGKKAISNLGSLEVRRDEWKDDYMLNKLARQKFRDEKKALKAEADSDSALLVKSSLDIPLQKEAEEDIKLAGLIKYRTLESYDEKQAQKRKEIESRPLFETAGKMARVENKSPGVDKLDIIKKQLKTTRESSYVSPFDRTKMNTLSPSVNRESLGIRKKSLPKYLYATKPEKESGTNRSGEEGESSKNGCCDGSVKEKSVENRLEICEMQEGSCNGQESVENVAAEGLTCTSCGKKINTDEGRLIEQDTTVTCTCKCDTIHKINSKSSKPHASSNILYEDCTKSEKEASGNEDEFLSTTDTVEMKSSRLCDKRAVETGLRLVCSYSDSDSDGSS